MSSDLIYVDFNVFMSHPVRSEQVLFPDTTSFQFLDRTHGKLIPSFIFSPRLQISHCVTLQQSVNHSSHSVANGLYLLIEMK